MTHSTPGARRSPRPLVLGSASPRRHKLLKEAGVAFEIQSSDLDERMDLALGAGEVAEDLARRKALAVAGNQPEGWDGVVLGADTVVVLGEDGDPGRVFLEKAADGDEAASMLRALSGTRHRVITGVAVVEAVSGTVLVSHETTFVTMRTIEPGEVAAYVDSGEWRGKAGGYAIQETADRFVSGLEGGGFDNVVGLPVERTLDLLAQLGIRPGAG